MLRWTLLLIIAQTINPTITATWQATDLAVGWTASGWHCAWLVGGELPTVQVGCVFGSGGVKLPTGNVDTLYAPQRRTAIELRSVDGRIVARVTIPPREYRIRMPWIRK